VEHLGIVRSVAEMKEGAHQLQALRREWSSLTTADSDSNGRIGWADAAETLNMLDVAGLIVRCALWRRESRGLHYVTDFPNKDNECFLRDSLVVPAE
jgi:succinate dehydrogenase/fumarate reductase flavoprotein subunit